MFQEVAVEGVQVWGDLDVVMQEVLEVSNMTRTLKVGARAEGEVRVFLGLPDRVTVLRCQCNDRGQGGSQQPKRTFALRSNAHAPTGAVATVARC